MTRTPPQQHALYMLKFAYISAIVVIVVLLTSAQLLVQASLREEAQARAYALLIGTQALRLQALELDILNLADKTQDVGVNALTFRATESVWESVHAQIKTLSLSADESGRLRAVAPFYQSIQTAARSIIALEGSAGKSVTLMSAAEKATFTKAFVTVFYSEPPDLRGLVYITQALNFEADAYVSQVQIIELMLFGLSLLTLFAEWVFVIRPANKRFQESIAAEEDAAAAEEAT